ncbi:MAG: SPOR domain-containing protein [Pseudomonas sp.]
MTSLHADEAFLSHYQFSHDPFASRVPGFKFFPAQRKPVLGQLHHLARYSQLLLVVSGPEGSGKTLLRQALVASTNKQAVHNLVVSAQGAAGATALLAQIALGLNAPQGDVASILSQVEQLALTGREVYLLVDDAEHLSEAALEALLLLAAGNVEGRPHVFLFSDVTLAPRLELLVDDDEQRFHVIDLQPYDQDETRDYLAQRLEGAGQDIALLSDEQVEAIHLRAQGWPGAINLVAHETLIEAMLMQRRAALGKKRKGLSVPKKTVLALALVAVGVGAAWVIRSGHNPAQDMVVAQLPPAQPDAPVTVNTENLGLAFDGSPQSLPLPMDDPALPLIREPLAQAAGLDENAENAESVESAEEVIAPEVASSVEPEPEPEPEAEPVSPPPVARAPVAPTPEPVAVAAPKPAPTPKPVAKPPVKAPAAVAKAAVAGDWYAGQTGGHYALQVFGSRSQSAAQDFARQRGDEYHSFKKNHQGKPLYVVTYGTFSTVGAARAAIQTLPAQVQAGKPWPRSFASIAKEITQAR